MDTVSKAFIINFDSSLTELGLLRYNLSIYMTFLKYAILIFENTFFKIRVELVTHSSICI